VSSTNPKVSEASKSTPMSCLAAPPTSRGGKNGRTPLAPASPAP
jgi:hypothetical protein